MLLRVLFTSILCTTLCFGVSIAQDKKPATAEFDVVVYSATPAGIAAAIAAARKGGNVLLLEPTKHVGGIMTSGLGGTDHCLKRVIGGISREVFQRIGKQYSRRISWRFEPHQAEQVFEDMLKEADVLVQRDIRLSSVTRTGSKISALHIGKGKPVAAKIFIDASYEGDLLAQAKVSFAVGRESRATYNEEHAGVQLSPDRHQFSVPVSGRNGDGKNLPGITPGDIPEIGSGDNKVSAYCFRLCVTDDPEKQVPIPAPNNYNPLTYEPLARYLAKRPHMMLRHLFTFLDIPSGKADLNNQGAFSSDFVGENWDHPTGDFSVRQKIYEAHKDYTLGLLHFLKNDERVPALVQGSISRVGLCKDEFVDNQNWPYQLYVREGRRMQGSYVLIEPDLTVRAEKPDSVGMASCPIESHNVQRVIDKDGNIVNEGWVSAAVTPYEIPYRALLPKRQEVTNLIVPVAVSASHVAYSSLRMEPTFMVLGQSAGVAAMLAVRDGNALHDITYQKLEQILLADGQVLSAPAQAKPKKKRQV